MWISPGWEAAEAQRSRGARRGDSAFGALLVALQRGRRQGRARELRLGARAEARRGEAAGPGGAAPAPRPLGRGTRRDGARGGAAAERRARAESHGRADRVALGRGQTQRRPRRARGSQRAPTEGRRGCGHCRPRGDRDVHPNPRSAYAGQAETRPPPPPSASTPRGMLGKMQQAETSAARCKSKPPRRREGRAGRRGTEGL